MNPVITEKTRVQVAGRVFEIPSEKVHSLISMLEGWKTVQVAEGGNPQQQPAWNGQTLLHG